LILIPIAPNPLLLLALGRHNNALLLEHLRQRAILVHSHKNIAATNELLVDVKLGYRRPLGVLLDSYRNLSASIPTPPLPDLIATAGAAEERTSPQFLILKHVECRELVRIHTLHAQDLYTRAREPALWCLRGALHEQHHGRGGDCAIDGAADLIREAADLERCEEAGAWGGGADGCCARGGAEGLVQSSAFLLAGCTGSCIAVRTWGIARLENMVSCVGCEGTDDGTEALSPQLLQFRDD
jgi:hypothetical protein